MTEEAWFGDHPKRSVVRAGAWATVANIGGAAVSFLGTVILSRLLEPGEVGLFALAFLFYSIPSLIFGPGLTAAAVQAPHLTQQQSSNLFWINVGVNATIAGVLAAAAPVLAQWFNQPAIRTLCPLFAVVLVLEGMATQYRALLTRSMRFDLVAAIGFLVACGSLVVAVSLAWMGFGVWSLVAQVVVAAVADRIALAAVVPWRPSWFDSATSVRQLLRFSVGSSLSLAMHMLYTQSQSLLLGRFASVNDIGFYNRGQSLFQKPFAQILGPLYAVLLPALSSRQRDPEQLGVAVYRANAVLFTLLPPLVIWMMMNSAGIAGLLLGPNWAVAGDTLFWFAVAAIPLILFGTLYKANEAAGRPSWGLGIRAAFLPFLLAGLFWAAPRGASTMAAVGAAVEWASAPVILCLLVSDSPIPARFYVRAISECIAAMALIGVVAWPINALVTRLGLPVLSQLTLTLFASYISSLLLVQLFPFGRAAWHEFSRIKRHSERPAGSQPA